MKKIDSTTEKLLERPMAKQIMKLLVDNNLSIRQILKKISDSDIQTIIAFLAELQRFGLVELSVTSSKETEDPRKDTSQNFLENEIINSKIAQFPPLGISVMEYNKLWEEISKDNGQINIREIENSTFTIPSNLKHLFKSEQQNDV
ncbi:MAG: hypothetical protein ACW98F_00825 [Candidatus Hodarchaeales archaeon]|jgi:hypothetical protein